MKTKSFLKLTFFCLSIFFIFANTSAQTRDEKIISGKEKIKIGIQKNDTNLYFESRKIFEQVLESNTKDSLALYYLTYSEYLLIVSGSYNKKSNLFDLYYDSAIVHVQKLIEQKCLESEAKALLAAIYMMKISKSPIEAPFLSGKINGLLEESIKLNRNNPRAYYLIGLMKFKTPAMFGGSKEEAIKCFKKAISIYEREETENSLNPDWGYLESLAWMGMLFSEEKKYDEAEFIYKKALDINPEYGWIKHKLLPDLEKEKNKK
jgi:tetratricopeptide (TPR) repeat protein